MFFTSSIDSWGCIIACLAISENPLYFPELIIYNFWTDEDKKNKLLNLNLVNNYLPRLSVLVALILTLGIMIGQQIGDLFGPFNKAVIARVKVFFVTHIQRFGLVFKAVKIEMINQ